VLARRPISPLEQFVLRAAAETDNSTQAVQALLGLDDQIFEDILSSIVEREWVRLEGLHIVLRDAGRETLASPQFERSEERVVSFDYDGLLRAPLLLRVPLEPEQRRAAGLFELPANPARAPDVIELGEQAPDIQDLIRAAREGRDQEADLLAVKGVLRRERVFREATLMIFRDEQNDIQAAPILDGKLSSTHESALADPAVRSQLRLRSELRRGRQFDQILPSQLRSLQDTDAERAALQLRLRAYESERHAEDSAESDLRSAGDALGALAVRRVGPEEQRRLIRVMAIGAKRKLTIATPTIARAAVTRELLDALGNLLKAGGEVTIISAEDAEPPKALSTLANDYETMTLARTSTLAVSTVIRDGTLALRTLYPVLADRGYERPIRDERGWLVKGEQHVSQLDAELPPKPNATTQTPAAFPSHTASKVDTAPDRVGFGPWPARSRRPRPTPARELAFLPSRRTAPSPDRLDARVPERSLIGPVGRPGKSHRSCRARHSDRTALAVACI
jgi:hypothetical protein